MWNSLCWSRLHGRVKPAQISLCMDIAAQKPPWKNADFCVGKRIVPSLFIFKDWVPTETDRELQEYKDKIAIYEKFHIWELAKKMANHYECIYTQDDTHFHPSLCLYRPLSRSFYKMIEILHILDFFDRIPKTLNKIRSAHVAEGPGGFIEALLEVAGKKKRVVSTALAMTLKPTDNHTPGWRRASNFLQKHREVVLHYGPDGSGDIYKKENQASFITTAKTGVHLFTADGGFDFSTDYMLQEKRVYHLLICSVLIGLQVLQQDGFMIIKLFDIYGEPTQILISVVTSCFKEWTLYKPATSRPCNSERYLLCRGFRGASKDILSILTSFERLSAQNLYPTSTDFLSQQEKDVFKKNISDIVATQ